MSDGKLDEASNEHLTGPRSGQSDAQGNTGSPIQQVHQKTNKTTIGAEEDNFYNSKEQVK